MNYNITGYCIYLSFTFTVIVYVGLICYKHGQVYCLQIFNGNEELTKRTNNILLTSYYLFNMGYCLITINNWQSLYSWKECIDSLSRKSGLILIAIGFLHFLNIISLIYISQKQKNLSQTNQIL